MDVPTDIESGWVCRRRLSVVDVPTLIECGWMCRRTLSVDGLNVPTTLKVTIGVPTERPRLTFDTERDHQIVVLVSKVGTFVLPS